MNWIENYLQQLTTACDHYEQTAPTVRDHCDDLFQRIEAGGEKVTLAELTWVYRLWSGPWLNPNAAANLIYKVRKRLGMDTTGHAGF